MSGTSLDGADAVLLAFDTPNTCHTIASFHTPYSDRLRADILALQDISLNELEKSALLSKQLSHLYAETVHGLLNKAQISAKQIHAIGCHGQTIRHRPELGFTLQIVNASLLAELTDINVVNDFRSRDIAAGGQGAPLVPAFHQAVFSHPEINRAIINIGGIANLTYLPVKGQVIGFDSGAGNMLMDAWAERHIGQRYDTNGAWAETGTVITPLFDALMSEPYLQLPPPKSTGRDLFSMAWLNTFLNDNYAPEDVQRTLLEFTAMSIANAVKLYCPKTEEIYLCGGGAHNNALIRCLQQCLHPVKIDLSNSLGVEVSEVEAAAFAWLARQTMHQATGNIPNVTGAQGARVLGAVYAR